MNDMKWVGRTLMILVSCAKAMLVILFFMHLKWEANWKYVLTIPASMMSIFLLLMLVADIMHRGDHYSAERKLMSATERVAPTETTDDSGAEGHGAESHGSGGH